MMKQSKILLHTKSENKEKCLECGLQNPSLITCQRIGNSKSSSAACKICKRCMMGDTNYNLSRSSSLYKYSVDSLNLSHLIFTSDEEEEKFPEFTSIHNQRQSMSKKQGSIKKQHHRSITPGDIMEDEEFIRCFQSQRRDSSYYPSPIAICESNDNWEDSLLLYPPPALTKHDKIRSVSPVSFDKHLVCNPKDKKKNENKMNLEMTSWEAMTMNFSDVDKMLEDRDDDYKRLDKDWSSTSSVKQKSCRKKCHDAVIKEKRGRKHLHDGHEEHNISDNHNKKKLRKTAPRMWSEADDDNLMRLVRSLPTPTKWPQVAHYFLNRSGKQCRERYLNHLNPKLVRKEWTIEEDVTIFQFYTLFGAQWAKMANVLPGRTDNNIKNRFHHVRRKLEKDTAHFAKQQQTTKHREFTQNNDKETCSKKTNTFSLESLGQRMQTLVDDRICRRDSTAFQRKVSKVVGHVAAKAIYRRNQMEVLLKSFEKSLYSKKIKNKNKKWLRTSTLNADVDDDMRSFQKVDPYHLEQCSRCNLFLPSTQCGSRIHRETHWCESCSTVPCYISRDSLYDTLWTIGQQKKLNLV